MYENLTRKSIIAIVFLVFSSQLCILSYDLGNDYSMELENLLQFRKHACHKPMKVLMSRFLIENVSQIVVFVLYFLFFTPGGVESRIVHVLESVSQSWQTQSALQSAHWLLQKVCQFLKVKVPKWTKWKYKFCREWMCVGEKNRKKMYLLYQTYHKNYLVYLLK